MQREVVATSSAFDLYNLVPKISVYSQAALLHTPSSVTFLKLLHKFDIRKNSFTKKVIKHWNRLSRKVVGSPSVKVFKSLVDVALWDSDRLQGHSMI